LVGRCWCPALAYSRPVTRGGKAINALKEKMIEKVLIALITLGTPYMKMKS